MIDQFFKVIHNGTLKDAIALIRQDDWRCYDTAIPLSFATEYRELTGIYPTGFIWVYYDNGTEGPVNVLGKLGEMILYGTLLSELQIQELWQGYQMLVEDMAAQAAVDDEKSNPLPF